MSSLAFPAPMGRGDGARPHYVTKTLRKARFRGAKKKLREVYTSAMDWPVSTDAHAWWSEDPQDWAGWQVDFRIAIPEPLLSGEEGPCRS
jgi:hypothetical protein